MADAVTSTYLFDGQRRKVIHLTNLSDGTGESAVVKVDLSAITFDNGVTPTYSTVDKIDYRVQGFSSVQLFWDHTTDDLIANLASGQDKICWERVGGKTDPQSSGGTGDIVLTTNGAASGASYDITIHFLPKV